MYAAFQQTFIQPLQSVLTPQVEVYLVYFAPLLLVAVLADMFWHVWMRYVWAKFYASLSYVTLEIRLPKEMSKSPLAMESFLNSVHNTADGSLYAQLWKGEYRPFYSLEIISVEGQVKFVIWCEDQRKGGIMTALYSQFPGIEVHEIEDYTRSVHFDPDKIRIWASEFKFTKDDSYPIKTYVDYGLDKDPKEEFKVDPLLPMLEFMGSVKPNQQVWIQIPIRAHKNDQRKPGHLWKKTDLWKDGAEDLMNKIMMRNPKTKIAEINPETGYSKMPMLSEADKDLLTALARSITKQAFDAGIRGLYISPKDTFDTPFGIGGIIGNLKNFNAENLNGFKPNGKKWHNKFDGVPWEDFRHMRRNRFGRLALQAYKRRSYFYPPFKSVPLILNTEELATIWHFPGAVATTPTLTRLPSKKAQAPSNLPV